MPVSQLTDQVFGRFNVTALLGTAAQLLIWVVIIIVVLYFLRWYWNREKYNFFVDIWRVQRGVIIPQIDRNIKGGYITEKGVTLFKLLPAKYKNAVCQINTRHIIKDGKKYRVFLRLEGNRYLYSFVPKIWANAEREQNFYLEVEDSSIVNQAITKDRLLRERHNEANKWEKYLQFLVPIVAMIVLIILIYYTYKWATDALGSINAMRATCANAAQSGGWVVGLIPKKIFKNK